jgi:hypothetical protein
VSSNGFDRNKVTLPGRRVVSLCRGNSRDFF